VLLQFDFYICDKLEHDMLRIQMWYVCDFGHDYPHCILVSQSLRHLFSHVSVSGSYKDGIGL